MSVEVLAGIVGRRMFPNQRIFHLSSAPGERALVYVVWIVRFPGRIVLVDSGFPQRVAAEHGIDDHLSTADLLAQLRLTLGDVDDVVVSHFHYDHFAAPSSFPRATFHVQRDEVEYWLGRGADHPVAVLVDKPSLGELPGLVEKGRVNVVDGGVTDIDGLKLARVGGHTPGSQITLVDHGDAPLVLACDASHTYDNLGTRTPAGSIHNYDECQRGFATVEALAKGGRWFPGHDAKILDGLQQMTDNVYRVPTEVAA